MPNESTLYETLPTSEGCHLSKLVVVSPYLSIDFFLTLRRKFGRIGNFSLITDSSVDPKVALRCEAALTSPHPNGILKKRKRDRLLVTDAQSFMHAKLYYFEFRRTTAPTSPIVERRIYWGSANATTSGFTSNAEVLSWISLAWNQHRSIINYFSFLSNGPGEISAVAANLSADFCGEIHLPRLSTREIGDPASSFDEFLAQGMLLHEWTPPASFLRFSVKLLEGIPQGDDEREFAALGFRSDSTPDRLQYRYASLDFPGPATDDEDDGDGDISTTGWRSKYCIQSSLGYWCSREAFDTLGATFVRGNRAGRRNVIDALRQIAPENLGPNHRYIQTFVARLEQVSNRLGGPESANRYFGKSLRAFLEDERERAVSRMVLDVERAKIDNFAESYVSQIHTTRMPRYRSDSDAWEIFCSRWVEVLLLEGSKRQLQKPSRHSPRGNKKEAKPIAMRDSSWSLLWRALKEVVSEDMLAQDDAGIVLGHLRSLTAEELRPLLNYYLYEPNR